MENTENYYDNWVMWNLWKEQIVYFFGKDRRKNTIMFIARNKAKRLNETMMKHEHLKSIFVAFCETNV